MVVVLPAPLGPRNPVTSPDCAVKEMPLTAVTSPYFLTRFSTSIMKELSSVRERPVGRAERLWEIESYRPHKRGHYSAQIKHGGRANHNSAREKTRPREGVYTDFTLGLTTSHRQIRRTTTPV